MTRLQTQLDNVRKQAQAGNIDPNTLRGLGRGFRNDPRYLAAVAEGVAARKRQQAIPKKQLRPIYTDKNGNATLTRPEPEEPTSKKSKNDSVTGPVIKNVTRKDGRIIVTSQQTGLIKGGGRPTRYVERKLTPPIEQSKSQGKISDTDIDVFESDGKFISFTSKVKAKELASAGKIDSRVQTRQKQTGSSVIPVLGQSRREPLRQSRREPLRGTTTKTRIVPEKTEFDLQFATKRAKQIAERDARLQNIELQLENLAALRQNIKNKPTIQRNKAEEQQIKLLEDSINAKLATEMSIKTTVDGYVLPNGTVIKPNLSKASVLDKPIPNLAYQPTQYGKDILATSKELAIETTRERANKPKLTVGEKFKNFFNKTSDVLLKPTTMLAQKGIESVATDKLTKLDKLKIRLTQELTFEPFSQSIDLATMYGTSKFKADKPRTPFNFIDPVTKVLGKTQEHKDTTKGDISFANALTLVEGVGRDYERQSPAYNIVRAPEIMQEKVEERLTKRQKDIQDISKEYKQVVNTYVEETKDRKDTLATATTDKLNIASDNFAIGLQSVLSPEQVGDYNTLADKYQNKEITDKQFETSVSKLAPNVYDVYSKEKENILGDYDAKNKQVDTGFIKRQEQLAKQYEDRYNLDIEKLEGDTKTKLGGLGRSNLEKESGISFGENLLNKVYTVGKTGLIFSTPGIATVAGAGFLTETVSTRGQNMLEGLRERPAETIIMSVATLGLIKKIGGAGKPGKLPIEKAAYDLKNEGIGKFDIESFDGRITKTLKTESGATSFDPIKPKPQTEVKIGYKAILELPKTLKQKFKGKEADIVAGDIKIEQSFGGDVVKTIEFGKTKYELSQQKGATYITQKLFKDGKLKKTREIDVKDTKTKPIEISAVRFAEMEPLRFDYQPRSDVAVQAIEQKFSDIVKLNFNDQSFQGISNSLYKAQQFSQVGKGKVKAVEGTTLKFEKVGGEYLDVVKDVDIETKRNVISEGDFYEKLEVTDNPFKLLNEGDVRMSFLVEEPQTGRYYDVDKGSAKKFTSKGIEIERGKLYEFKQSQVESKMSLDPMSTVFDFAIIGDGKTTPTTKAPLKTIKRIEIPKNIAKMLNILGNLETSKLKKTKADPKATVGDKIIASLEKKSDTETGGSTKSILKGPETKSSLNTRGVEKLEGINSKTEVKMDLPQEFMPQNTKSFTFTGVKPVIDTRVRPILDTRDITDLRLRPVLETLSPQAITEIGKLNVLSNIRVSQLENFKSLQKARAKTNIKTLQIQPTSIYQKEEPSIKQRQIKQNITRLTTTQLTKPKTPTIETTTIGTPTFPPTTIPPFVPPVIIPPFPFFPSRRGGRGSSGRGLGSYTRVNKIKNLFFEEMFKKNKLKKLFFKLKK